MGHAEHSDTPYLSHFKMYIRFLHVHIHMTLMIVIKQSNPIGACLVFPGPTWLEEYPQFSDKGFFYKFWNQDIEPKFR